MEIFIKGVNVDKGLASARGRLKSYVKFLEVFCREGTEKHDNIEASVADKDILLYTTYAHGLKSASHIIGADEFSNTAEMLEIAGNNGDWDYIHAHNEKFLTELKTLVENVNKAIPELSKHI